MKFLNPVFLPTLFILTVAATPLIVLVGRCANRDSVGLERQKGNAFGLRKFSLRN